MIEIPRIIDVVRKPRKCPVCGERVVDIIYGTGDMTEILLFEKKQKGISFSLAERKELKETSTLTKPLPIWRGCN